MLTKCRRNQLLDSENAVPGHMMHPLLAQFVLPASALICALLGAIFDVRSRRIPNLLTVPAMLAGLALHLGSGGWREMLSSFCALLVCGLVFLVFYLAGGMGAGDVKLIAAEGCILGLGNAASLLVLTAIAGGVLAVMYAGKHGRLQQVCGNVAALAAHHSRQGLNPHPELNVLNAQTLRLPYALAIAAGCILTLSLEASQVYP